jgi:uncharacterized protein with GYD domain
MAAYVILFNFTDQGIRNAKDSVKRAEAAREAGKAAGIRWIGVWWLLGQYDGIVIVEAPNDEVVTQMMLQVGMAGNIRSTTMRAFSEEEMTRISQGLG